MPSTDVLYFLNGDFQPLSEARIPTLDRGLIAGDGIYEVVPSASAACSALMST